jgi:hypothetical protein
MKKKVLFALADSIIEYRRKFNYEKESAVCSG